MKLKLLQTRVLFEQAQWYIDDIMVMFLHFKICNIKVHAAGFGKIFVAIISSYNITINTSLGKFFKYSLMTC